MERDSVVHSTDSCQVEFLYFRCYFADKQQESGLKLIVCAFHNMYILFFAGDHPKDFGHSQSALDVLLWPASQ